MIEVEGPDGAIHEFPEGTSPEVIKGAMQKQYAAAPAPHQGSPAGRPRLPMSDRAEGLDVLKTTASWPARGLYAMAGIPGLVEQGAGWLAETIGGPEQTTRQIFPTPEDLMYGARQAVQNPTAQDWLLHEPTSPGGKIVGFTQDIMTPGGIPSKVDKTVKAVQAGRKWGEKVVAAAPKAADLENEVRAAYQAVQNAGIHYDAKDLAQWIGAVRGKLKTYKADPKVTDMLDRLEQQANSTLLGGQGFNLSDLDLYRQEAGGLWAGANATDPTAGATSFFRHALDHYANVGKTTKGNVPAQQGQQLLTAAREKAQRHIRDKQLAKADRRGERFGDEYSNKVRQSVRSTLNNDRVSQSLRPEQLEQLQKVYKAGDPENLTSSLGRGVVGQAIGQIVSSPLHALPGGSYAAVPAGMAIGDRITKAMRASKVRKRNANVKKELELARALMRIRQADIPSRERLTSSDIVRALIGGGAVTAGGLDI